MINLVLLEYMCFVEDLHGIQLVVLLTPDQLDLSEAPCAEQVNVFKAIHGYLGSSPPQQLALALVEVLQHLCLLTRGQIRLKHDTL